MKLNVVLFEPEIPQNTGNIARTCAATGAALHLVGPLGYSLDEKRLRRAGLDYWDAVSIVQYADIQEFFRRNPAKRLYFFSTKGRRCHSDVDYLAECGIRPGEDRGPECCEDRVPDSCEDRGPGCRTSNGPGRGADRNGVSCEGGEVWLVFGKETAGIPEEILKAHPDTTVRIPMIGGTRSLNLSNSVAIAVYEVLRQQGFEGFQMEGALHRLEW